MVSVIQCPRTSWSSPTSHRFPPPIPPFYTPRIRLGLIDATSVSSRLEYFDFSQRQENITTHHRQKQMSLSHPPIPEHLRPHIWAKSLYNYPAYPNLPVHSIAEFLFAAINLSTSVPFQWSFVDSPQPGSLSFVWMSPQDFATPPTDGYQYLDPESVLHLPVGDKIVEVYEHKYGFMPRTDTMTGYVRRRFHLVQGGNPQLWLIHYLRAPDEDRLPVTQAAPQPYPPRPYPLPTLAPLQFYLSVTGQLSSVKNANTTWAPNMPTQQHYGPPQQQQPFVSRTPQVQPPAYRPQQQQLPPQAANKRVKVEEDEDEDAIVAREVAAARFVRWTEWMEEILSSGYNIRIPNSPITDQTGDILPPATPIENLRPEMLIARTQSFENDIRTSKAHHEETLQRFKSSCKLWKEGTKNLAMTANPIQDVMATRVDGVAAAAKDAESAVSLAMTEPSHADEIEEINRQILAQSGIPGARIRKVKKVRPVGKHIEFEPARKIVTAPPGPPVSRSPNKGVETPIDIVVEDEDVGQDGHADEAFEAMDAMDFVPMDEEFGYDSENQGGHDITMDMGVD